jgi:Cytochrome P450
MPYLCAVLRESHRLGNISITIPLKQFPNPITVHGVDLPAGSVVALDTLSQAVDPALVGDDAKEFKPERFLQSAVEARAGTAASVMDHSFFSDPFSQGARKCPGRRVANFEALALLAQLILVWKFELADQSLRWQDMPYDFHTVLCVTLPPMKFQPRKSRAVLSSTVAVPEYRNDKRLREPRLRAGAACCAVISARGVIDDEDAETRNEQFVEGGDLKLNKRSRVV